MESPNYYAVIPATVRYDSRLKANEKLLYAELTALAKRDGFAWPSNQYLSDLYQVSKETVSRWLSELQDYGYIKICIDKEAGNQRRIIVFENQEVLRKNARGIDKNIKVPIDENVKHNNTSINNKKEQDQSLFHAFWSAYPKKVGKAYAEKVFGKINPDTGLLETMLKAIDKAKQCTQWQEDGGKYIPNPSTWLNQERWEDELSPTKATKPEEALIAPPEIEEEDKRHEEVMRKFRAGECSWEELIPK